MTTSVHPREFIEELKLVLDLRVKAQTDGIHIEDLDPSSLPQRLVQIWEKFNK